MKIGFQHGRWVVQVWANKREFTAKPFLSLFKHYWDDKSLAYIHRTEYVVNAGIRKWFARITITKLLEPGVHYDWTYDQIIHTPRCYPQPTEERPYWREFEERPYSTLHCCKLGWHQWYRDDIINFNPEEIKPRLSCWFCAKTKDL